jgi:hypothetical protein
LAGKLHCDVTAQGTNQNPENDPCFTEEIVMNEVDQERRSGLEGLAIGQLLAKDMVLAQASAPQDYVLGAGKGEHLIHFRDHGQIVIEAGSATGFDNLRWGPSK